MSKAQNELVIYYEMHTKMSVVTKIFVDPNGLSHPSNYQELWFQHDGQQLK